jgi:hypothetical protein
VSRWEDLLSPDPVEPDAGNLTELMRNPLPPLPSLLGQAGTVVDRAATLSVPVWRLADTPEPPEGIIRLKPLPPPGGWGDSRYSRHQYYRLARATRSSGGRDRGWWWVIVGHANPDTQGWAWSNPPSHRREYDLVQELPVIHNLNGDLALNMINALPHTGRWYRIGVSGETGTSVWAWSRGDGACGLDVSDTDPNEEED